MVFVDMTPEKAKEIAKELAIREAAQCVEAYRRKVESNLWTEPTTMSIRDEVRGKNLACFCRLDQPCHADVLLELANR